MKVSIRDQSCQFYSFIVSTLFTFSVLPLHLRHLSLRHHLYSRYVSQSCQSGFCALAACHNCNAFWKGMSSGPAKAPQCRPRSNIKANKSSVCAPMFAKQKNPCLKIEKERDGHTVTPKPPSPVAEEPLDKRQVVVEHVDEPPFQSMGHTLVS